MGGTQICADPDSQIRRKREKEREIGDGIYAHSHTFKIKQLHSGNINVTFRQPVHLVYKSYHVDGTLKFSEYYWFY